MENEKYTQARDLYFQTELTQEEIARIIGISGRTLYRWMKQDEWKRIKAAARQAPAALVERFYVQLQDLNDTICNRPIGQRIPTMEEAEINRKIIYSISKLKQQSSKQNTLEVMMNFTTWLNRDDSILAKKVVQKAHQYISGDFKDHRQPWEMEYDCDEVEGNAEQEDIEEENEEDLTEEPDINSTTFEVDFAGLVKEDNLDKLPEVSGIYNIWEAFDRGGGDIAFCSLLFVGPSDNIHKAVTSMLPGINWKKQPRGHTSLYITYAEVNATDRTRIAAALIHESTPPLNDEHYKQAFPFDDTTLHLSGHTGLLPTYFTIERKEPMDAKIK